MINCIEVKNVTKTYRLGKVDVPAVRGVELQVPAGEFIAIVGPSGCGKSTLLHLLGGLLGPTTGDILIDGIDIAHCSDRQRTEIRRRKIGIIFQRFNLFPTISARANIELASYIYGNGSHKSPEVDEILDLLGLKNKMNHKPLELSGGEQQRVAIARAVINRPAVLLADEPTGNLDSFNSNIVLNMLLDLNRHFNQTILMITHNSNAASYAHRVLEMLDGMIVGQPECHQVQPEICKV